MLAYSVFLLALVVPLVRGHGYVHNVTTPGGSYPGWNRSLIRKCRLFYSAARVLSCWDGRYASPVPARVVRKIPSDGPVADVSGPDIACNQGGEAGTPLVANVTAGSQVTFQWEYWPADHLGPVSTYMTSCNGDCTSFDASNAKWFKLDAEGYDNGQFASAKLIADNFSWHSTVPAALADGQYLMRHEIIALHSTGDPQYYPSCTQVSVSGGGSGVPADQYLVAIPGLYDNIQWPNIYSDPQDVKVPGPPVVQFDSSAAGQASSGTGQASAAPSTSAGALPTSSQSMPAATASAPGAAASAHGNLDGKCGLSRKRALSAHHAVHRRRSH